MVFCGIFSEAVPQTNSAFWVRVKRLVSEFLHHLKFTSFIPTDSYSFDVPHIHQAVDGSFSGIAYDAFELIP